MLVLLEIPGLEFDRADIPQGLMPSPAIIEPLDVFEQILFCGGSDNHHLK